MSGPADAAVDLRAMPLAESLAYLREHGEPADPRPDVDTASLRRRFPHLAGVQTSDLRLDCPDRRLIEARLYRDATAAASGRALVWVHGGAFIGGHLDMPESNWVALELASRGIPVLALDYVKCRGDVHFPEPSDDVLIGWRHALAHAEELFDVGPDSVVLGGASAGGNLTAGIVARLRDTGEEVPSGLVLVYPALHPGEPGRTPDPTAPWMALAMNYSGRAEVLADPYAWPGIGSAAGFPPTLIVVCEKDGLRPSGEAFAGALADAGVPVTLHLEPDADHGHINEPADPTARPTVEAIVDWILEER